MGKDVVEEGLKPMSKSEYLAALRRELKSHQKRIQERGDACVELTNLIQSVMRGDADPPSGLWYQMEKTTRDEVFLPEHMRVR